MPWLCASSGSLRIARNAFPALLFSQKNSIFAMPVAAKLTKHDKIDHPCCCKSSLGKSANLTKTMQPERAAGHEVHEF